MFSSWIQDKLFLKKIKTHTKSSWETTSGGWKQISEKRRNCAWKEAMTTLGSSPQLYEKLPEKAGGRKFTGSSSKSLSLENAVLSLICRSKHALMYYYGWRGDSCWNETQDERQEFCKDNKNAASTTKPSKVMTFKVWLVHKTTENLQFKSEFVKMISTYSKRNMIRVSADKMSHVRNLERKTEMGEQLNTD